MLKSDYGSSVPSAAFTVQIDSTLQFTTFKVTLRNALLVVSSKK